MSGSGLTGVVGARYEIIGPIASGGMGTVYRALDLILHRTVALKVLRTTDDPTFHERFAAEARNAARLSHPGIVQVFDFGEEHGVPYIAMEFVEGTTLRALLASRGRLTPTEAARIAAQVASALDHAHRAGLIHSDVKPENILLDAEGRARVVDFGLARAFAESRATQAGSLYGTAQYLAPEQVTGADSDHRADIYALGITIFEMVAGRVPFTGESPVVIAYRRVGEDVPDVRTIAPEVPPTLAAIIARATARDVEARYPTAAFMSEALRALATDLRHAPPTDGIATESIPLAGMPTMLIDRMPAPVASGASVPPGRRMRRRTKIALIAAVVALATLFAFTVGPLATAIVPKVTGETEPDARRALRDRGFGVDVSTRYDATVPENHVIAQSPKAGVRARTSSGVRLFVSLGPLLITLLDVRGETEVNAVRALKDAGFTKVTTQDAFHPKVPKGEVAIMDPEPGELTASGTPIVLTVSKGPEFVNVPNVVGDPEAAAREDLKRAGFEVSVTRAASESVGAGNVISQSPAAGTRRVKGSKVSFVVSTGPAMVVVPDLYCMSRKQAEDAAKAAGVKVAFDRDGRRVVDQEPVAGTKVRKGSTVTALMGTGIRC